MRGLLEAPTTQQNILCIQFLHPNNQPIFAKFILNHRKFGILFSCLKVSKVFFEYFASRFVYGTKNNERFVPILIVPIRMFRGFIMFDCIDVFTCKNIGVSHGLQPRNFSELFYSS